MSVVLLSILLPWLLFGRSDAANKQFSLTCCVIEEAPYVIIDESSISGVAIDNFEKNVKEMRRFNLDVGCSRLLEYHNRDDPAGERSEFQPAIDEMIACASNGSTAACTCDILLSIFVRKSACCPRSS